MCKIICQLYTKPIAKQVLYNNLFSTLPANYFQNSAVTEADVEKLAIGIIAFCYLYAFGKMFQITSSDGEARSGTLVLPHGREITTPGMLLYTRRGGSLHLTPDLLDTLRPNAQALQLSVFSL
jgi:hypothetical protein